MTEVIRQSFRKQAEICTGMGAPLTGRVLEALADRIDPQTAIGRAVLDWPGDPSASADALPLRLAGGLHALVLSGRAPALAAVYSTEPPASPAALADALADTLRAQGDELLPWLQSPPQTNEMRRSAVLIAAGHWLAARYGMPLILSELGASAGLNLIWDRYALTVAGVRLGPADAPLRLAPDWTGPAPEGPTPRIAARAGVDLNPLDPDGDRLRLLAYLWAGQQERIARTRIAAAEASRLGHRVEKGDAGDWLEARLQTRHAGHLHLVYHTVVWQYFPPPLQARCTAMLEKAGRNAPPDAPIAHLAMEADGAGPGAAITLQLWPEDERITLGRADFHGRWIDWQAPPANPAAEGRLAAPRAG